MTPEQMGIAAIEALFSGTRVTLVRGAGEKMPRKFPRGELLCVTKDGARTYGYDPVKIIAWLRSNQLMNVTIAIT